ncbi:MAG: hypothetical protein QXQ02_00810 [Halobacteria archaeon]
MARKLNTFAENKFGEDQVPYHQPTYEGESGAAQVEESFEPGFNRLSLTKEEMRRLGVNPDKEEIVLLRNPQYWSRWEGSDRALEFRQRVPGGRILLDESGMPVGTMDVIYAAYPKEYAKRLEAQEKEQMKRYINEMSGGMEGDFDPEDKPRIRERVKYMYDQEVRSRMIGVPQSPTPTFNLTYEEAIERIQPDMHIPEKYVQEYAKKVSVDKETARKLLTVKLEEASYRVGGRRLDREKFLNTLLEMTSRRR